MQRSTIESFITNRYTVLHQRPDMCLFRKFNLPRNVQPEGVSSNLSGDGILSIKAEPLKPKVGGARIVPVWQQSGASAGRLTCACDPNQNRWRWNDARSSSSRDEDGGDQVTASSHLVELTKSPTEVMNVLMFMALIATLPVHFLCRTNGDSPNHVSFAFLHCILVQLCH